MGSQRRRKGEWKRNDPHNDNESEVQADDSKSDNESEDQADDTKSDNDRKGGGGPRRHLTLNPIDGTSLMCACLKEARTSTTSL